MLSGIIISVNLFYQTEVFTVPIKKTFINYSIEKKGSLAQYVLLFMNCNETVPSYAHLHDIVAVTCDPVIRVLDKKCL